MCASICERPHKEEVSYMAHMRPRRLCVYIVYRRIDTYVDAARARRRDGASEEAREDELGRRQHSIKPAFISYVCLSRGYASLRFDSLSPSRPLALSPRVAHLLPTRGFLPSFFISFLLPCTRMYAAKCERARLE
jgi:hypothetical protein